VSAAHRKHPTEWMLCIGRFHNAYLEDPAGPLAAQALFMEGLLYHDLAQGAEVQFGPAGGTRELREDRQRIADSPYAAKASKELLSMTPTRAAPEAVARRPASPPPAPASSEPAAPPADTVAQSAKAAPGGEGLAVVQDLQHWSNPNYTRVVSMSTGRRTSRTAC